MPPPPHLGRVGRGRGRGEGGRGVGGANPMPRAGFRQCEGALGLRCKDASSGQGGRGRSAPNACVPPTLPDRHSHSQRDRATLQASAGQAARLRKDIGFEKNIIQPSNRPGWASPPFFAMRIGFTCARAGQASAGQAARSRKNIGFEKKDDSTLQIPARQNEKKY